MKIVIAIVVGLAVICLYKAFKNKNNSAQKDSFNNYESDDVSLVGSLNFGDN
jgi:hypothetical protein